MQNIHKKRTCKAPPHISKTRPPQKMQSIKLSFQALMQAPPLKKTAQYEKNFPFQPFLQKKYLYFFTHLK